VILAHLANFAYLPAPLAMFFQDTGGTVSFSASGLISNMGWPARIIAIILFIMSIWSLAVMIDRWLYFNAARKQSREFAPKVAGALKDGRLDEAIKLGDRSKKSHLAEVVTSGLQEFRSFGSGGNISEEQIESSQRALERAEAIVHAKLKRGLGGHDPVGIEPGRQRLQVDQGADEQAGSGQQHDGEGDLPGNQRLAQAHAAHSGLPAAGHR